jgi:hypothetical protein
VDALVELEDGSELEYFRADGRCLCECGEPYWRHPEEPLLADSPLVLHVLCSGERVKL